LLLLLTLSAYGQDTTNVSQSSPAKESSFKLYPNPVIDDVVYITTARNRVKDIVIYDVFGFKIIEYFKTCCRRVRIASN